MKDIKKIICYVTAGTIIMSGIGISINSTLKRKSNYDGKTITSYSMEYSNTEISIEVENSTISYDNHEFTTEPMLDVIEDEQSSYEELKNELDLVLQEKKLDANCRELITKTFDYIYNNYSSFEEVYKLNNPLTKEEFIQKNIINNLKNNVSIFKLVDLTTYEGDVFGGYYTPSTKTLEIGYYGNLDDLNLITKTIHELSHASQLALFYNDEIDSNLLLIFTEGQSTVNETTTNDYYSLTSGMNFSAGKDNEYYSIKGVKSSNPEYIIYSKCYGALYSIVDHEVLQKVNETGDIKLAANYITNTYGIDGNMLLNEMSKLCNNYISGNENDICNSIKIVENSINKCFYEKLKACNTQDDILSFMNLKRNYNMQFASVCLTDYEDKYSFNIAKKSDLDPYNINDVLYNKCLEYGVIANFSNNETTNRMVFGSIMGESTDYFSYYAVGEKKSVLNQQYSLSEDETILTIYDNNKPILQFDYKTNIAIREQEDINNSYVSSSPESIVVKEKIKVM